LCGFDGGLRRDEISEARVGWFELETKVLDVSNNGNFVTKDWDNRVIPLTDRVVDFLKVYLEGRDKSQYVLAPEKTEKSSNRYRYDVSKRVRPISNGAKSIAAFMTCAFEARMGLVRIVHLIRTLEYIHKNDNTKQTNFNYDFNLARNRP